MNQANPFQQTMVRMQIPPGGGTSVSARGFTMQADADGCVEVPKDVAEDLKSHGLVPFVAAADNKVVAKK